MPRLTADPDEIAAADGVVLPGVGAFGRCMESLAEAGLADDRRRGPPSTRPPAAGRSSGCASACRCCSTAPTRPPGVAGLDVLPGRVRLLPDGVKRPQMQWNILAWRRRPSIAWPRQPDPAWVYFVHSYAVEAADEVVTATCDYGGPVVAMVGRGRLWATQFHPEKSGTVGLSLLHGFVEECAGRGPVAAVGGGTRPDRVG